MAHPASRRAAAGRWAHPWAGRVAVYWSGRGRGRGRGRGGGTFDPAAGRSRPALRSRGKQVRYKNRTLIRARGVLPQQPLVARAALISSSAAASAAAARRAAFARRASVGAGGRLARSGVAPPPKFVRSGKHGMAIRRVKSSDLAARRAVAASSSSPSAKRLKVSNGGAAGRSTAAATGGTVVQAGARGSKAIGDRAAVAISKKSPSASTTASTALLSRKAALLSKAGARSVAARRAAAVVAGARAKRSRLQLIRNMTLYRGKGEVKVVGGKSSSSSGGGGRVKEAASKNKRTVQKSGEPCLFFCRFGKCSKSDEDCRYVHDKSKVAVCRAFLSKAGCDKGDKCLLTHAIQAEKMPVCIYFERGMCFTPNCPYLHVKVSRNAAVCPSFLKGYCPDGTACRLKHELPNPRKRTRDVSNERDQGSRDDEATSRKKTRSGAAPETGTEGLAKATTDGSSGGRSGELVGESERTGPGAGAVGGDGGGRSPAGKVEGGDGKSEAAMGGTLPGLGGEDKDAEEDEEEDDDDDLKPAFLRKRKKR
eukprot:g11815.t1